MRDRFVWHIKKIHFDESKSFNMEVWIRPLLPKKELEFSILFKDCYISPENNKPIILYNIRIENPYFENLSK